MTDNPQDLAYSRLFARYDEALERISVLSRENIALQKATQQARLDALEEAAKYCDTHTMGVGHRKIENKFAGYIAEPFNPSYGSRHEGNGYAAAIRALKEKQPE